MSSSHQSQLNCKWTASLYEALRFLRIGQLVDNGLFKSWVKGHGGDLEYNIMSWTTPFLRSFIVLGLAWRRSLLFWRNTHTECGSGSGMSIILDTYAYATCVCGSLEEP